MMPDPDTPEGMDEINKRLEKRRNEAKKVREQAEDTSTEEPTGKMTEPSELDIKRERKNDE